MTTDGSNDGLFIDSNWKEEAAREKARLAEQEAKERAHTQDPVAEGPPSPSDALFFELVNMLAMQAMIGLGGYQGPGGETIPPNNEAARHHIDMLGVLSEKTRGNLSDEESKVLERVLHELRLQFVQHVGAGQLKTHPDGAGPEGTGPEGTGPEGSAEQAPNEPG